MNELISIFKDRKKIIKFLLASLVCFIISVLYKEIYRITPAYTILEPINPFAPAIGLYLGPIGSAAMVISNIFMELIYSGHITLEILFRIVAVFVASYLPYMLWYTLVKGDSCKIPNLDDTFSIYKYICVMLINSVCVSLLLYTFYLVCNAGGNIYTMDLVFFLFNGFNLSILFGIPIMVAFSAFKISRITPIIKIKKLSNNMYLYLLTFFVIISIVILCGHRCFHNQDLVNIVSVINLAIILFICFNIPFTKKIDTIINSSDRSKITIKGKVTLGFLIFGYLLIIFDVLLFHIVLHLVSTDFVLITRIIYIVIGICTYYVFSITLLIMKNVEKKVTNPLDKLSNAITDYSKIENYNNADKNKEIKTLCSSIKSDNEVQKLALEFCRMIDKIEEYCDNLRKITEEREREKVEINLASKIQESILPREVPAFPDRDDFDISASMAPAKMLGGDFYDYFMTEDNKLCFLVADVSGKGVPAALVMMSAKTTIKDYLSMHLDIVDVVKKVNMNLCRENEVFMFITAFLAVIDLNTGTMEYVSAGHNPPLLRKNLGEFQYLDVKSNCILAVDYYADFVKQTINLNHGDVVFIYTDGVTEALNNSGHFYGADRLLKTLNSRYYDDSYQIIPFVKNSIIEFTDGFPQSDDITMLIFKYK